MNMYIYTLCIYIHSYIYIDAPHVFVVCLDIYICMYCFRKFDV